jgi:hypothetical protein
MAEVHLLCHSIASRPLPITSATRDSLDAANLPRPLPVLESAAAIDAVEVIPLLAMAFVDAADATLPVAQRLVTFGTAERGRRRVRRIHGIARPVRTLRCSSFRNHAANFGGQLLGEARLDKYGIGPRSFGKCEIVRGRVARHKDDRNALCLPILPEQPAQFQAAHPRQPGFGDDDGRMLRDRLRKRFASVVGFVDLLGQLMEVLAVHQAGVGVTVDEKSEGHWRHERPLRVCVCLEVRPKNRPGRHAVGLGLSRGRLDNHIGNPLQGRQGDLREVGPGFPFRGFLLHHQKTVAGSVRYG